MRIKVLGSSAAHERYQFAASYVINDVVAIDAGSLGFGSLAEQTRIRHVFISHTHLDHIASLPIFIDNVYAPDADCPMIYGSEQVTDSLQKCFFNDQIWPDIVRMSREGPPFAKFSGLEHRRPVWVDDLCITPVALHHVVPCFGFLIEQGDTAVALISDTGPTEEIWAVAKQSSQLKGVFLESAYPNSFDWLANKAAHLTPAKFLREYRKLGKDVAVVAIHIKCAFYDQVVSELKQLGISNLIISEPNHVYEF